MSPCNRKGFVALVLGAILYLSLFSAFALYHAYANDELIDSHGCQIGEWVQHGQTAIIALALAASTLPVIASLSCVSSQAAFVLPAFGLSARAPPLALR